MKFNFNKQRVFTRKRLIRLSVAFFFFVGIYVFRIPILSGFGSYLIVEDVSGQVDAIVVLGGSSLDRGTGGAELYLAEISQIVVCTGGNIPDALEILNKPLQECSLTKLQLEKESVPPSAIVTLCTSTSTKEEAEEVLAYCLEQDVSSIIVVSDKFHTRRVGKVFRKIFEESEIVIFVHGVSSSQYDEDLWWESERGMIMVNNEYMKLLYYWVKY